MSDPNVSSKIQRTVVNAAAGRSKKTEDVKNPVAGCANANSELIAWLYASHGPFYDENVARLEQATAMKREHLAYITLGLYALMLVVSGPAEFFCNMVAFIYPAYASVVAIRSVDTSDDTHWLIYWTVFGVFSLFDFFLELVPFYFMVKAFFLMYLYLPQTQGSKFVYYNCVDPLFDLVNAALYGEKTA